MMRWSPPSAPCWRSELNASRPKLLRAARLLAGFTVTWNVLEGVVAMAFGVADESIALLGFGLDSWVEVGAAGLVLWRLKDGGDRLREKRATGLIGGMLLLLALTTAVASGFQLWTGGRPDTTLPGVVVAGVSLSFMFGLWRAKDRVATALDDSSLKADAACSKGCLELSFVLLAGSLLYLLVPTLWWVDSVAALVLAGLIAREGVGTVRASRQPEPTSCACC